MKKTLIVSLVALASLSLLMAANAQKGANSGERRKKEMINRIKASNAVQIFSDNSLGSPVYIQEAVVKEITGDDFTMLTGEASSQFAHSTFPDVNLVNNTSQTLKSFAIVVKTDNKPRDGWGVLKENLSIPPGDIYKIDSSEWPKAERLSIQKGGQFTSVLRKPGLDSAKAWIPGAASDLKVTVGFAEFEDGSQWMIPKDLNW